MASLGDLVTGVTHELNTPIGAAQSAADVAGRCLRAALDAALQTAGDGFDATTRREVERCLQALQETLDNTTAPPTVCSGSSTSASPRRGSACV